MKGNSSQLPLVGEMLVLRKVLPFCIPTSYNAQVFLFEDLEFRMLFGCFFSKKL